MPPPDPAPLSLRFFAAVDRARNALAFRVYNELQGDAGAIAAAMVTGKRDFLSDNAKELIRRAGIFHVVTISGVQMSLVAGIFSWACAGSSPVRELWRSIIRSRNGRRRWRFSPRFFTISARARALARSGHW
jgi:predicted membrane metal-binding protein